MPQDRTRSTASEEHGWLITPRALSMLATTVGLVYTLQEPVRWALRVAATVDALDARVTTLESTLARQHADTRATHDTATH